MKNFKFLTLLFFSIALFYQCTKDNLADIKGKTGISNGEIHTRSTNNVCVASWNTQLLDVGDLFGGPQCEGDDCDFRAQEICDQVSEMLNPAPDIVNFQEVFEQDAAAELIQCMTANGYSFNTGFDGSTNTPDCFNLLGLFNGESEGSGLITFSQHPITSTTSEDFTDCNGCTSDGNDCVADKGMILTEIELPCGTVISNLNTHLDSSDDEDDVEARRSQLEQMRAFLDANVGSDDVLLLSGDFNINKNSFEYQQMLDILGNPVNTAGLAGVPDGVTSTSGTIDYILGQNLISSTYEVSYQETYCWWEHTEIIRKEEIDQFSDLYLMNLDPVGIDLLDFDPGSQLAITSVTNRYNSEEEIPADLRDKVKLICRGYEDVEIRNDKDLVCGYYLNLDINVEQQGFLLSILNVQNYEEDINSIPFYLRDLYVYDCILELDYMNPSDHNPILSCVEF